MNIKPQWKNLTKRIVVYFVGIMLTGFSVNLMLASELGAGAWDTVNANLSQLADITVGTASAMVNVLITLFVVIANRQLKYLFIIIPILGISTFIDIWHFLLFTNLGELSFEMKFLFLLIGFFIITFGLALIVVSKFPAMVFDEWTLTLMRLLHIKSFTIVRWIIEYGAIILASAFGFAAGIGFGAVSWGTLILSFVFGPMVAWHIKWTSKLLKISK